LKLSCSVELVRHLWKMSEKFDIYSKIFFRDVENFVRHLCVLVLRHQMRVSNYFVNSFYSVECRTVSFIYCQNSCLRKQTSWTQSICWEDRGQGRRVRSLKNKLGAPHRPRIPSPPPLRVAKTGRNNLNEEFTPLLPTGIGERF
jgi:hypothetical protein